MMKSRIFKCNYCQQRMKLAHIYLNYNKYLNGYGLRKVYECKNCDFKHYYEGLPKPSIQISRTRRMKYYD